jgi:hypothetical protein
MITSKLCENTVTCMSVTIDGVWFGLVWLLDLLHALIQSVTTLYSSLLHTHQCPQSRPRSRCLVAASNGGRSLSSEFSNYSRASATSF